MGPDGMGAEVHMHYYIALVLTLAGIGLLLVVAFSD
jgi:hypothetical protein